MKITGADRYQPEKVAELEKHVDEQVSSNTFSLDANLALLRFYQFNPAIVKASVMAKVLLKALMRLPSQDYKACIHLVPERLQQTEESIYKIVQMANALETSRFSDFWTHAVTARDLVTSVPGFYEAARSFIAHTIGISFQRVTKRTLAESFKLEGATLDQFISDKCSSAGWSVVSSPSGDLVALPKNDYNQLLAKRTQEMIKFDQVLPVLKAVTVGF